MLKKSVWLLVVLLLVSLTSCFSGAATDPDTDDVIVPPVEVTIAPTTESVTMPPTEPVTEAATKATTIPVTEATSAEASEWPETEYNYILNMNTMRFHYVYCKSVETIAEDNIAYYAGTREDLIARGFIPCGNCHP